jgi:hypothetical protein
LSDSSVALGTVTRPIHPIQFTYSSSKWNTVTWVTPVSRWDQQNMRMHVSTPFIDIASILRKRALRGWKSWVTWGIAENFFCGFATG